MRSRFFRIFTFALMLTVLLTSMPMAASAAGYSSSSSSSNSFTLLNMSGHSITEVYFYPSSNRTWGNARNRGWISNGREANLSFTSAEMRLNVEWSIRIGFDMGRYVSYVLWDEVSPAELVAAQYITVYGNAQGGYTLDYGGSDIDVDENQFTLLNMSGLAITEVYFYPVSNSTWGNARNKSWIYNGQEEDMQFNYSELGLDVEWCMRLGFNMGRYVSYVYWDGLTLADFVNCDYVMVVAEGDGYTIYFENDSEIY